MRSDHAETGDAGHDPRMRLDPTADRANSSGFIWEAGDRVCV